MVLEESNRLSVKESLDSRLEGLLEHAAKVSDAAYAGLVLYEHDPSGEPAIVWQGRGQPGRDYVTAVRWALLRAEPLLLQEEADAKRIVGSTLSEEALPLICIPITSNGAQKGALIVGLPPSLRAELPQRLPILEPFAELAGALLEIAALRDELYQKEERVRHLIKSTLDTQEAERERICLEVHDGVTQTLASAFQYLQTLESTVPEGTPGRQLVLRASALVRQAMQESREVINSLQPATLKDLGLVATLRQEMRQLEAESKWKVDFKADSIRLPQDMETGLYRIVSEAITNVRKHAGTDRLRVRLEKKGDHISVEIRDWGAGFDPKAWSIVYGRKSTGLLSMRKRAELLQGNCTIESSPGQGTAVIVEIPAKGWERK